MTPDSFMTPVQCKKTKKDRMTFLKSLSKRPQYISFLKAIERVKVNLNTPSYKNS
jgi:hypothetical protein